MTEGASLNCPSCGATLAVQDRFTKVVICEYCGQTSVLKNRSLDPTGKKVSLADVQSEFSIGREGTLRGSNFKVLGRLRYDYEDGYWDEVNGDSVFITEKNKASITGGLGQLMFRITPGEQISYVDGNCSGELVSIEFSPEEINLSKGEALSSTDFQFAKK